MREAGEDRQRVAERLHVLGMARHEHAHEVARFLVAFVAADQDFVDVLAVEIADRTLDQRAFLVDQRRRGRFQRQVAHVLPQPQQIFEVALDLHLGAARAGGAQDHAHAFRHFEILRDLLEATAVRRVGDLAADAAAARGVRHQHRIAAGEREVGGQRRALGAALFLHHLHQHDLPALDDLLNLVLAARAVRPLRHFLHRVGAADRFDRPRLRRSIPDRETSVMLAPSLSSPSAANHCLGGVGGCVGLAVAFHRGLLGGGRHRLAAAGRDRHRRRCSPAAGRGRSASRPRPSPPALPPA